MNATLYCGDVREVLAGLPEQSVQCVVTSPPYWGLRDYGVAGQLGLEKTPDEYVAAMVGVFREVRRVLRDDGVLWLNLGDSYSDGGTGANKRYRNATNANTSGARDTKKDAYRARLAGRCQGPCTYSRSLEQPYPRLCVKCGQPEPPRIPDERDGLKAKDLVGIPWMTAFALRANGWYLRSEIIWAKCNPMPESVTDRPTKAHEQIFLLSKSQTYYYDTNAIAEPAAGVPHAPGNLTVTQPREKGSRDPAHDPGRIWAASGTRNARTVWTIATQPYAGAHFATFPEELARRCILAGSRAGDTILDPFGGSGTVASVAVGHGRSAVHIDLNPAYIELARQRIGPMLCLEAA